MKRFTILLLLFLLLPVYASKIGEYNYVGYNYAKNNKYYKYIGIQQQLRNQRMIAYRNQLRYRQNPLRNIRYPSVNNPYPNITPNYNNTYSQRYSSSYYSY